MDISRCHHWIPVDPHYYLYLSWTDCKIRINRLTVAMDKMSPPSYIKNDLFRKTLMIPKQYQSQKVKLLKYVWILWKGDYKLALENYHALSIAFVQHLCFLYRLPNLRIQLCAGKVNILLKSGGKERYFVVLDIYGHLQSLDDNTRPWMVCAR